MADRDVQKQSSTRSSGSATGGAAVVPSVAAEHATGLTTVEAQKSLEEHGYNEVVVKEQPVLLQILSRYLGIVPLFMTTTAVLSAAIFSTCDDDLDLCDCNDLNDWASFVLLLLELNLIVYADYTGSKSSGDAIKMLQEASASKVGVKRDGDWVQLPTRELVPGDVVAITIGMTIPADGVIASEGEPLKLDYSSLTGEPLPEKKGTGDLILSGAVVLVGEADMLVTKTGEESSLGTTQALVAAAKEAKETGGTLASLLSTVALVLCAYGMVMATVIGVFTGVTYPTSVGDAIKLSFVILTTILPVTMPLVLTTTLAVGSQELAKDDAVVQRFSAIPEMAGMDILCSDKTGTLTLGKMTIIEEESVVFHDDVSFAEMMELALVASRIEFSDAIDAAITKHFPDPKKTLSDYEITKFVPFDPTTKKVTAVARKISSGEEIVIVKGAPPVLMAFEGVDDLVFRTAQAALNEKSERGFKTLAICVQNGDVSWKLLGFLAILDPPRSDTALTIKRCKELGVDVKMITGDQRLIAVEVARQLQLPNTLMFDKEVFGANSRVADEAGGFDVLCERAGGFAGVSPEHKHRVVTSLQGRGHFVGMTGDGVNDAPALSIANVGIAVAGATDAARGASDIVLQQEGLSTIVLAIWGARRIFRRIETYLTYRMCSSITFGLCFTLIYCASGFNFPTWTLILMSLLNDFAVTSSSKDNVYTEKTPQVLNLWKVSAVGGTMAIISSLQVWGFVDSIVRSSGDGGHFWGLRPLDGGVFSGCEAAGFTFLTLITTIQLDLIAARSPKPFWMISTKKDENGHWVGIPPPSWHVLTAVGISLTIATFIGVYWEDSITIGSGYGMQGIGWRNAGLTWAWSIMWFVITDSAKALAVLIWDLVEKGKEHTTENFYSNIFAIKWDRTRARKEQRDEVERLRESLRGLQFCGSIASGVSSSVAGQFSIGLAALAAEQGDESIVPITHQHMLLEVDTLAADPGLLRVISAMANSIAKLDAKVKELEKKLE